MVSIIGILGLVWVSKCSIIVDCVLKFDDIIWLFGKYFRVYWICVDVFSVFSIWLIVVNFLLLVLEVIGWWIDWRLWLVIKILSGVDYWGNYVCVYYEIVEWFICFMWVGLLVKKFIENSYDFLFGDVFFKYMRNMGIFVVII